MKPRFNPSWRATGGRASDALGLSEAIMFVAVLTFGPDDIGVDPRPAMGTWRGFLLYLARRHEIVRQISDGMM